MLVAVMDIARGLAALSVCIFHFRNLITETHPFVARLFDHGDYGVPLFFVVSGYSITASAQQHIKKNKPSSEFLRRRLLRIYPPFLASIGLIVLLPYTLALLSFVKSGNLTLPHPAWLVWTWADWLELITMTKLLFHNGDLADPFSAVNGVYWTLTIEMQFYLVMYLALVLRRWHVIFIVLVSAIGLASLLEPRIIETGMFIGFWSMFAFGIGLYFAVSHCPKFLRNMRLNGATAFVVSFSAIAIVVSAAKILGGSAVDLIYSYSLFALICALLFYCSVPVENYIMRMKKSANGFLGHAINAAIFLGTISYSVYLLHPKIYQLPEMALRQIFGKDNLLYWPLTILGILVLSWLFHLYFERPFMSRTKPHVSPVSSPSR